MAARPTPLDREHSWQVIEQQRRAIADLLSDLSPQEWEHPSLCAGWRVRHVAAHLAMTPSPPPAGVMITTGLRARGDYNRFVDLLARRYSEQPVGRLVSSLRDHAATRRIPRLTNYRNVLMDTMVHGQDIAIPLGRTLAVPPEAAAAATAHAATLGRPVFDRHRLRGIRLRATDIDWCHGAGLEVRGPIAALLLLVTGRTARLHDLAGEGLAPLTERLVIT
ncbi:maleylpyruvate isomerase family mycothiol-dependent enzyme [Nocardia sp. CY41]|uniref:maleylpyruvate isomerase family mycothiol-dependent enzyme n=1 Tax=Nocardia sp. CY41 TaxID=2608686 RepID=UPI001359A700|nr:maleylpyruvate isomerase family mycothiol-dependent enzyme [Nocardia sp. CY41]